MTPIPFLTAHIAPVDATFKAAPEDFEVHELPAYRPSGSGDHVMAGIEKRDLTTPEAVARLCREVDADPSTAGWAGLKDRHAVTRQWVSLFGVAPARLQGIEIDGIRVLEAVPHRHKLRTGHLRGNRFRVRLHDVDPSGIQRLRRVLAEIETVGLPNYFGPQRFGRDRDNADRALTWVSGERRAPRQAFQRKLEMSALQADLFNGAVAARVRDRALGTVIPGDLMKRHDTGGLFVVEDGLSEAQERADRAEISATGPIFGAKMPWPAGEARAGEEALLSTRGLTLAQLEKWKRAGAGTRRFVRVFVSEIGAIVNDTTVNLDFTLPAGTYATILVREIRKRDA